MEALTTGPRDQRRCHVLDIPVDVCRDVTSAAIGLHAEGGGQIVTLNAEMTMLARRTTDLGAVIRAADLVVPDGAGVVWALARQGVKVKRSPGIELAWSLFNYAEAHGWRVALVGASPEVMDRLCDRLAQQSPELQLVFAEHGYQDASAWPELETRLRRLSPDLVLVALGVPLQEIWIQRMRDQLPGLWMGVGGSFDVWSGLKQRAPGWTSRLQLEWLYRLLQDPTRWKRYLALPQFAWSVLCRGKRQS